MQNVIRRRAKVREGRLPSDGSLLGIWSVFKSARREVSSIDGSAKSVGTPNRLRVSVELISASSG